MQSAFVFHCCYFSEILNYTKLNMTPVATAAVPPVVETRPDMAFAVSEVSWVLNKPTKADREKVKRIFKYLKGTYQMGIMYQIGHQPDVMTTFSDAGDIDTCR